jgi:outer membrane protein insertion porin family
MRAVAALLIVVLSTLVAQTVPKTKKKAATAPAPADKELTLPIVKLTVEGNERIPAATILTMSGLKVGDNGTKEAFDAAQKKILDSGFFDKVNYGYGPVAAAHPGFAAKFQVVEAKPLYPVQFAGFTATNDDLTAYLKSRDPLFNGFAPPTHELFERWSHYLDEFTASKNQPKKVVGKLLNSATGDYFIQFQPDEPLAAVARVEFTGNEAISSLTLQNSIGAVAYGLPYSEQNFREFLDHQVRPLYEAIGLMRVKFDNITTEPVPPPVKGVLVHVRVTEGPVYKLGKVGFTGARADQKDDFAHIAGLKPGQPVNFDQVSEASDRIRKNVRRNGYLNAKTSVDRKIDDTTKKVDVTFKIDKGQKYEFGTLTIQGLDLNGTAAIQKQWGKQPGDPYNPDYPDYFLAQVKDEGIFDHMGPTRSDVKLDEDTHVANVTLVFLPEVKQPDKDKRKRGEY